MDLSFKHRQLLRLFRLVKHLEITIVRILIGCIELFVIAVVKAFKVKVLMIGQFRMNTHHGGHAYVRTYGRDAAKFNAEIGKTAVGIHVALTEAQTSQMIAPESSAQLADDLNQRLDLACGFFIALTKSIIRKLKYFTKSILNHMQFLYSGM